MHRGVSNAPYRSEQQNRLDCGFKRAAMTIASKIDMTRFFCRDALYYNFFRRIRAVLNLAAGDSRFAFLVTDKRLRRARSACGVVIWVVSESAQLDKAVARGQLGRLTALVLLIRASTLESI